jgi:hypothetical protein
MASKDENKSMEDNQAFLKMNSKIEALVVFVKHMDDMMTNYFDDWEQT